MGVEGANWIHSLLYVHGNYLDTLPDLKVKLVSLQRVRLPSICDFLASLYTLRDLYATAKDCRPCGLADQTFALGSPG